MEVFVGIFVVVAVVALAALVFIGWVVVSIFRALFLAFRNPIRRLPIQRRFAPFRYVPARPQSDQWAKCPRDNCRTPNPTHAQFCRRCGMNLVAVKVYGPPARGRELMRA